MRPSVLSAGPLGVPELAQLTRSDEDSLYRLLRALAGSGIFTEVEERMFSLMSVTPQRFV